MASPQPLFRAQALAHYAQRREKSVLPHLVAPPVFLCCWLLLGLLILATVLAWQAQVPMDTTASGALLPVQPTHHPTANGLEALLFVPAHPALALRVGDAVTVRVVLTGEPFTGTIATILPGVMTPEEARQQYALTGDLALIITQPSVVVQVTVGPTLPPEALEGMSLSAQVQVGSQSVLALLPHLLSGLFGG